MASALSMASCGMVLDDDLLHYRAIIMNPCSPKKGWQKPDQALRYAMIVIVDKLYLLLIEGHLFS